jgi:hypothetical protein
MSEGSCRLCDKVSTLVKSHIVPRSFYGVYARQNDLRGFGILSGSNIKYKQGIYGQFLCQTCERKFQDIDNWANNFFKSKPQKNLCSQNDAFGKSHGLIGFECSVDDKLKMNFFASSVLWRAKASNRHEYKELILGKYEKIFKESILNNCLNENISIKLSLMAWFYDGSEHGIDDAFEPLRHYKSNVASEGKFQYWGFGFPSGQLFIRVGGDAPKYGYFESGDAALSESFRAVIWSHNLSESYPLWACMKSPRQNDLTFMRSLQELKCSMLTETQKVSL